MTAALPDLYPLPTLTLSQLSDEEKGLIGRLRGDLAQYRRVNDLLTGYYEASNRVRDLGISIPPNLRTLEIAAGWAGTALDVLEERLHWDGFVSAGDDLMGLDEIYRANHLNVEQSAAHIDALISGVSFVTTGRGDESAGEPQVLITAESPSDCTMQWDVRQRRATAAYSRTVNQYGTVTMESLYLPNETIRLERTDRKMVVVDRDQHNLNRVLVACLPNRPRASRMQGRSEITRTVRYVTDSVMRWLLGMEVNREFYTTPQRYLMGATKDMFVDENDNQVSTWEARMGQLWTAPRTDDGELPVPGEFPGQSPTPYATGLDVMRSLFAAEVGIPASYLGVTTDNPASADAILRGETRLIKRSLRRQDSLGLGWWDTAYNSLLVRDGEVDVEKLRGIRPDWTNPATPTPAAQADAGAKQIAIAPWLADTEVGLELLGLSKQQIQRAMADKRRAQGRDTLARINAAVADVNAAGLTRVSTGADTGRSA